ncbi:cell envelope biogenesis protein OmpA [Flavobacterium akiainvivens]|uniref:Cell envelope biogenesis protein OmpA n=1 Tax=Flavobacterium akiainvivens TaxID=1202724 RepID=A0A0M8ME29_9FLAO|nr:OmpA family protein [Flavobacterium akiainvivens]KOS06934.1 cell envelope biogenesis protein OmpA [Flavobacterium akiainvivens]
MKNLYITLGFMFATVAVTAQTEQTKDADKHFARMEYVDAAADYLKVSKKDDYVKKQLAECYYITFNAKEAVKWYADLTKTQQDAETYFKYAQMLKALERYDEANAQMKKFAGLAPNDQRAKEFLADPNYLPALRNQAKMFDEKLLDINDAKYSSFGGLLTADNTFYFTSARNTARRTYGANEQPFLDIYTATYNANATFSEPVPLSDLNSKWHEGTVAVTEDGNTMYFAAESFKESKQFERDKDNNLKVGQIYLYKATKQSGKWVEAGALPFNDKAWSTNAPALSKDGKWLYFSSDRTGTTGGMDIWKVEIKGGNNYGTPVNLGPKVNTPGREDYPYIDADGRLFFSSDSHKGFGGLDIFYIEESKGTAARNVGQPVNSGKDDFAFSFNKDKNIGFFASNRGEGNIDKLYSATPVCGVEAIVLVKDAETGQIIAGAQVAILDEKNNVIERRTAGADGKVTYNVDCDRAYTIQASAPEYESNTFPVAKTKGGVVNVAANLNPIKKVVQEDVVVLNEIYFEYDKSNITKEAAFELDKLVEVLKKYPNMVIMVKSHTDSRGSDKYNMRLSDRRAKSTVQYVISKGIDKKRISGQGYGESQPKVKCTECTDEQHAQNRRSEFIIVKQ